jgi:hypothetical protein
MILHKCLSQHLRSFHLMLLKKLQNQKNLLAQSRELLTCRLELDPYVIARSPEPKGGTTCLRAVALRRASVVIS